MELKAGSFTSPIAGIERMIFPKPLTSNVVPYISKAIVFRLEDDYP